MDTFMAVAFDKARTEIVGLWRILETGQRKLFVRGGMLVIPSIWENKLQSFGENPLTNCFFSVACSSKNLSKCGLCCRYFTLWLISMGSRMCDPRP